MSQVTLEQEFLPSASSMWLVRECSGMPAMQQRLHNEGMLLDMDTPAAERGREGHEGIAGEEYDEELIEEASVEEANALETSIYREWLEHIGDEKIDQPERENRFFGHISIEPIFTAKPDLFIKSLDSPRGLVIDHKLGFDEVDPPEINLQTWTQVAAVSDQYYLEEVAGDICQPGIHQKPRISYYSGQWLKDVKKEITRISLSAIYEHKLRPGVHCGYCPARMGCMAGIAWANKQKQFAEQITEKVALLDPVKSDMVYEGLGSAIKILAAVKKLMVAKRREDQNFLPGHKWINGRRSVENTPLAIARLMDEGMNLAVLESSLNFVVGDLTKVIKNHFNITESAAKEKMGELLAGLIKTAPSTLRKKGPKELNG
jgi:hypothetical protein